MLSLILHPNGNIRSRKLTAAELKSPNKVLSVEKAEFICLSTSIAMWVDTDYLDRSRDEFNVGATFLTRDHDFSPLSLRGPVLLCALREDETRDNFTVSEALLLYRRIRALTNPEGVSGK